MKVLGLSSWPSFWSLGRKSGANSFFLSPYAYVREGHEVHVSTPSGWGQPLYEDDQGVLIHRYRGAIRFDSNMRHPMPVRVFSRVIRYVCYLVIGTWNGVRLGRRIRPDLVIGYGVHSAVAASITARLLGVPNITRLFGFQLHLYLRSRWKLPGAFMDVFALKVPARYIIIHNDGSRGDEAARMVGVPPERLRFWRDGLDSSLYPYHGDPAELRKRLDIPLDHVVLFCVGRLGDDKRMGRLVEILPDILKEEPGVTLMLVGDGPERGRIEERIRALRLEPRVRLTGAVSRDELPGYLAAGDIFVGVSHRTNANLAPIEAMTAGKPVVALDTGTTSQMIEDGVSGMLIDPDSWREALPRALLVLIRDRELRERLGRGAREKVLREVPSVEERLHMEVELGERAVREFRAEREAKRNAHTASGRRGPRREPRLRDPGLRDPKD